MLFSQTVLHKRKILSSLISFGSQNVTSFVFPLQQIGASFQALFRSIPRPKKYKKKQAREYDTDGNNFSITFLFFFIKSRQTLETLHEDCLYTLHLPGHNLQTQKASLKRLAATIPVGQIRHISHECKSNEGASLYRASVKQMIMVLVFLPVRDVSWINHKAR